MNNGSTRTMYYAWMVGVLAIVLLVATSSELLACKTCGCSAKKAPATTSCGAACKASKAKVAEKVDVATINTEGLAALIRSKAPVVVLDARFGKYDDGRRIPGAKGVGTSPSADVLAKLVKDKDTLIVTYCTNLKCPASSALHDHLKKLGYRNVVEYPHGIEGWAEAGNQVTNKT